MLWKWDVVPQYICKRLIPTFAFEGSGAEEHFIDQDAKSPPVNRACMATAFDDFWGYIFFCANKGIRTEVCYA
jgi:hypothetical protein